MTDEGALMGEGRREMRASQLVEATAVWYQRECGYDGEATQDTRYFGRRTAWADSRSPIPCT